MNGNIFLSIETIIPVGLMVLIATAFSVFYIMYIKMYIQDVKCGKVDIDLIDEFIYNNLSHVKRRKKIIKTIKLILFYGLLIIIAPILIFSIWNKLSGNITNIGDKGVLAISSGSMSLKHSTNDYLVEFELNNQFNTFDLIVIESVESNEDLSLYDVVVFKDNSGRLIVHRIVKIENTNDGIIKYTTRGDSNNEDDEFKSTINDIKGKYINQRIPFIGAFVLFFQSLMGIITIVILLFCVVLFDKQNNKIILEKKYRLEKFAEIDILGLLSSKHLKVKLYYMGYIYLFDEAGFVDKEKNNKDDEFYEESFNSVIKVCEGNEPIITKFEV